MSNILQQYYQGVVQQLRSEVDLINALFQHQGVKGEGNESVIRDLLTRFIPKRYGISTGVIIDRHGNHSRQCDIVIYDSFLYPSLLSLTHSHLFPVDIVYAVIEVKTTLNSQSSKESLQNIASVRSLDYIQSDIVAISSGGDENIIGLYKSTPPIGIVFAYNSEAIQDETFRNWFNPVDNENISLYPSLVGCLDMGMIGFTPQGLSEEGAIATHPEAGMQLTCMTLPLARQKEDVVGDAQSPDDVQFLKLAGEVQGVTFFPYNGILYPIKKVGADYMPIDQGRIFLNFLLQLNNMLSLKKISPTINFVDTYLKGIDKFHFVL